jgi:hypothetical protein
MLLCAPGDREVDPEEEIESLGLRHRIVTRRTSLVAISEDPTVDPKDPRRRERLAVELPHGVSAEGVGLGMHMASHLCASLAEPVAFRKSAGVAFDLIASEMNDRLPCQVPPTFTRIMGAIVRFEAGVLVVEFETPDAIVALPDQSDDVIVRWESGDISTVRIVRDRSTRPGPHPAGVMVRLVFAIENGTEGNPVKIAWTSRGRHHEVELA